MNTELEIEIKPFIEKQQEGERPEYISIAINKTNKVEENGFSTDKRVQKLTDRLNTYKDICIYIVLYMLAFMVGINYTSFLSCVNTSIEIFSEGYSIENKLLLKRLSPVIYHFGGMSATWYLYFANESRHVILLFLTILFMFLGYVLVLFRPHIMMILVTRVLLGFSTAIICVLTPQIIHTKAPNRYKGTLVSLFPFFLLFGITCGLALMSFDTIYTYYYGTVLSLVICGIIFLLMFVCGKFPQKNDDTTEKITLSSFFFNTDARISFFSIVAIISLTKITGIDFLTLFTRFTGPYAKFEMLLPTSFGMAASLLSGCVTDIFGRKYSLIFSMIGISLLCILNSLIKPGTITAILYNILYQIGPGIVPILYINEIVPSSHNAIANRLAGIVFWILGFLVVFFIAFGNEENEDFIWNVFATFCIASTIIVIVCMKETVGDKVYGFLKNVVNILPLYVPEFLKRTYKNPN